MKYGINMTWNDLQKDEGALALVRPDTDRWPEFERNLSMDTSRLKAGCGVDLGDTVGSFAACLRAFEEQEEEAM